MNLSLADALKNLEISSVDFKILFQNSTDLQDLRGLAESRKDGPCEQGPSGLKTYDDGLLNK